MKPGATTCPFASIRRVAAALARFPIAVMRPLRMPTSAAYQGEPVPSMTWPLAMMTSNGRAGFWARAATVNRRDARTKGMTRIGANRRLKARRI